MLEEQAKVLRANLIRDYALKTDDLEDLIQHSVTNAVTETAKLQSESVVEAQAGTGGSPLEGLAGAFASAAVNAGIAGVQDAIIGAGNAALLEVRSAVNETVTAGFGVLSTGSKSIKEWITSHPRATVTSSASSIRTNNPGGSCVSDDPEDSEWNIAHWLLESTGEKLFMQNRIPYPEDLESKSLGTEIEKYLSRPVKVATYSYTNSSTAIEYDIWKLLYNNTFIKDKLKGYAYFRANLNVKLVLQASPFYYGCVLATYRPYSTYKTLGNTVDDLTLRTQRKNIYCYPQYSSGGEMELPFFFPQKGFPITDPSYDMASMGTLNMTPMTALRTSNGTPTGTVQIAIYAWFSDIYIWGATGATLQSATEAGVDLNLARTVAPSIPISASSMRLNSDNLSDKDRHDELHETNINYICRKDALVASVPVSATATAGTFIAEFSGNPAYNKYVAVLVTPPYNSVYTTPLGYISRFFRFWRGDILLRCKIIKTVYHRGRLRVTYDPGNSTNKELPELKTKIIDIGTTDEFTVNIPYITSLPYLDTGSQDSTRGNSRVGLTANTSFYDGSYCSGRVQIYVESNLSAPGTSDSIQFLFYIQGAPNIRFASPTTMNNLFTYNVPFPTSPPTLLMADEEEPAKLQSSTEGQKVHEFGSSGTSKFHNIGFGEEITNLLQLAKRTTDFGVFNLTSSVTNNSKYISTITHGGIPWTSGYYEVSKLGPGATFNTPQVGYDFEYVYTPFSQIIAPMYCGHYGDFVWTYAFNVPYGSCFRTKTYRREIGSLTITSGISSSGVTNGADRNFIGLSEGGYRGCDISSTTVKGIMSAISPYYTNLLFHTVDTRFRDGRVEDDSVYRGMGIEVMWNSTSTSIPTMAISCSAADNWRPLYFLNTPILYELLSLP